MSNQSSIEELGPKSIVSEVMYRICEVISKTSGRPRVVHLGHAMRDELVAELRSRGSMAGSSSGNERLRLYAPTGPVEISGGGADWKISVEYTPFSPISEYQIRFMTFGASRDEFQTNRKN